MNNKLKKQILEHLGEIKKLIEEEEKPKDDYDPNWRAEKSVPYYTISAGQIRQYTENLNLDDHFNWESGNYFKTREQAQKKLEYDKALMRVKRYIADNFGWFEPDWEDEDQEKWPPPFNWDGKNFHEYRSYYIQVLDGIYVRSKDDCKRLIKDCETDLKIIFGIKKITTKHGESRDKSAASK